MNEAVLSLNVRKEFLPFSAPSMEDDDIQGVVAVLKSGWITTGPKCAAFEQAFAAYVGAQHACALTSATAGMHCVLLALGLKPGDEVKVMQGRPAPPVP